MTLLTAVVSTVFLVAGLSIGVKTSAQRKFVMVLAAIIFLYHVVFAPHSLLWSPLDLLLGLFIGCTIVRWLVK